MKTQPGRMAENTNTERDYPELPARRRSFLCTKCGGRECLPDTLAQEHPTCKCGYMGFAEDLDFTADQMRAYVDADRKARASLSLPAAGQEPVAWMDDRGWVVSASWLASDEATSDYRAAYNIPLYAAPQPAVAAGWMPIETAPKGEKILLVGRDRKPCIDDWALYCRFNQPGFTHWMPLPPAPSTEGESNG